MKIKISFTRELTLATIDGIAQYIMKQWSLNYNPLKEKSANGSKR